MCSSRAWGICGQFDGILSGWPYSSSFNGQMGSLVARGVSSELIRAHLVHVLLHNHWEVRMEKSVDTLVIYLGKSLDDLVLVLLLLLVPYTQY